MTTTTTTTNTTTTEETFNKGSQYVPQKGDKVYMTNECGENRQGLVAEIVSIRKLVSGDDRVWFRYTNDEGETYKDSIDIWYADIERGRKRWAQYFFPVNRCTFGQKSYFHELVANRMQGKEAKRQEHERQEANTRRIDEQNAHLVNAAPKWSDVEVCEWTPRYKWDKDRASDGIPYRRIIKYVQLRRTEYKMVGYNTTRRVKQNVDTIRVIVTRVNGEGWMITRMPESHELMDFQHECIRLVNAAAAWCVEQNAIERDAIDNLRRSRGEMVAA